MTNEPHDTPYDPRASYNDEPHERPYAPAEPDAEINEGYAEPVTEDAASATGDERDQGDDSKGRP